MDAAFGGYEWFKVRDQGLAKVIYSTQGQDPAYTRQASLLVREEFERDNPAQVQKVVDVFVRASRWASDEANRDALFKLWEKSGVPYASWAAEFDKQDLAARNSPLIDDFIIARYKAVVADALKLKLIRREVSVDGWFDDRYLKQALRTQGLEHYWTRYDAAGKPSRASARPSRADRRRTWPSCPLPAPGARRRCRPGAPGRLDRRALAAACCCWRYGTRAPARLDLAAGAAAAGLCLGNAARPGRQRRPVAQHRRQPAARCGFAAGGAGPAAGVAMGLSRRLEAYLLPTFNALVQIPVLAWLPFVLLLVGIGEALKIILIAKAALVPVTLNTLQGFRQASPALREVGRVYGYTRRQEVLEIVLPLATPTLFTGLRLGFTKAWLSLVVVELVASSEGLGYLIVYRQLFQLDLVMAAVVVVGAIGYAIDRALDWTETKLIRGPAAQAAGAPR